MVDQSVLTSVRNYLRAVDDQGIDVRFGVLFGSYAAGKANEWSDIDLVVVSPRFDEARTRRDIDRLWQLAARVESRIEPIPCGEKQWIEDDSSAILEIARREGTRVGLEGDA